MVNNQQRGIDSLFGALSDQTRRAILSRLARGDSTVTELAEPFRMSLAAVSKHIKVLEDAGLVTKTKEGRNYRCSANLASLDRVNAVLEELSGYWNARLDALDTFLTAESPAKGQDDGKRTGKNDSKAHNKKSDSRKTRKGV